MSVYVVVHATPKSPEKMQAYAALAGPTLATYGGKLAARGPSEALAGEHTHKLMVLLEFPDKEAARRWYNSPEYQAAIPTRMEAMDSVFILGGE